MTLLWVMRRQWLSTSMPSQSSILSVTYLLKLKLAEFIYLIWIFTHKLMRHFIEMNLVWFCQILHTFNILISWNSFSITFLLTKNNFITLLFPNLFTNKKVYFLKKDKTFLFCQHLMLIKLRLTLDPKVRAYYPIPWCEEFKWSH